MDIKDEEMSWMSTSLDEESSSQVETQSVIEDNNFEDTEGVNHQTKYINKINLEAVDDTSNGDMDGSREDESINSNATPTEMDDDNDMEINIPGEESDSTIGSDDEDDGHSTDDRGNDGGHIRHRHRYDLHKLDWVNYQILNNHDELQLHQAEQEWYRKLKANVKTKNNVVRIKTDDMLRQVTSIVMNQILKQDRYTQVLVKEGVKRHGKKAFDAVLSEFTQLNDKNIFMPVSPDNISQSNKREALNLITLVKEKKKRQN